MDQETKKILMQHIASGRYIADAQLDVQKMFNEAGMGLYAKLCCDRIRAAGLVDGIHIFQNNSPPWPLLLDLHGVNACREILEAYLQPEKVKEDLDALKAYRTWSISLNNTLYALRKLKNKELRDGCTDALGYKAHPDDKDDIAELIQAERRRRGLVMRIYHLSKRLQLTILLLSRFRGPVRILFPFIKLAWKSWEDKGDYSGTSNGKYTKALWRFTDAHGGTDGVSKLDRDDLVRYIFLAVRTYGKENKAEYCHTGIKDCREVDYRYKTLKRALEAVGRLTPVELMQMYPVSKEYKGEKWNQKDYFFTMRELRKLPAGQPIGDAQDAAALLWDYQNRDLELLFLQWKNVLDDMYTYCNDHGPEDELYHKIRGKGAEADGEK